MTVADNGKLNLEEPPPLWGSRSVDCFEKLEQIGEGTYGYYYFNPTFDLFRGNSKKRCKLSWGLINLGGLESVFDCGFQLRR